MARFQLRLEKAELIVCPAASSQMHTTCQLPAAELAQRFMLLRALACHKAGWVM